MKKKNPRGRQIFSMQVGLGTRNIAHGPEITTVCYETKNPRSGQIFLRGGASWSPMYYADVCVTGAPAPYMVSLSEPCLLRHPTCLMFINLAKNDAGEGQNTNTLACGPNLCIKRVV